MALNLKIVIVQFKLWGDWSYNVNVVILLLYLHVDINDVYGG